MELKVIHNTQFHWFGLILVIFQWFNATVPTNEQYFRITQDETKPEVNYESKFLKTWWLSFPTSVLVSIFKKIIGSVFGRKSIRVLKIIKDFKSFIKIQDSRLRNISTIPYGPHEKYCHFKLNVFKSNLINRFRNKVKIIPWSFDLLLQYKVSVTFNVLQCKLQCTLQSVPWEFPKFLIYRRS